MNSLFRQLDSLIKKVNNKNSYWRYGKAAVGALDTIIRKVLSIFKPAHFIVSVFADSTALCGESNKSYDSSFPGYTRAIANTCEFVNRRSVTCSHYHATK